MVIYYINCISLSVYDVTILALHFMAESTFAFSMVEPASINGVAQG